MRNKYEDMDDQYDTPTKMPIRKMRPQGSLTNLHVFNSNVKQGATKRYIKLARKLKLNMGDTNHGY
jgi:hypothetical protein